MQRIRHQSRLKDKADFRFPWKREMITPMQTTQGPSNHYLMLLQSFQLFTTEDSRATWNNSLLDKLLSSPDQSMKQLEQMEEDNLCCSHLGFPAQEYFHGIHLYLRELEYSHFARGAVRVEIKSAFPSCKNPQRNGNNESVYICNSR